MNLHVINTGHFRLDGGAMFGVVPKSIWQRSNPADENNMCSWAMRCLLIEDGDRLILIDNGIGDKQDDKFFSFFYLHGDDTMEESLNKAGFTKDDITDVFLTHLHFDHCGGGVQWTDREQKIPELVFQNAKYWTNRAHWEWAIQPNAREKASFLKENLLPMQESGQLHFVNPNEPSPFDQFGIMFVDGHTEKQMIPVIKYKEQTIIFAADLLPSVGHIPLPYVMSYDIRPLDTLREKQAFLNDVTEKGSIIFFEHDPVYECATLKSTEKGPRLNETFKLAEITG
jgi:glyoxylase-like metal-dependent hydrolase (beta-lactamase superfamily II)